MRTAIIATLALGLIVVGIEAAGNHAARAAGTNTGLGPIHLQSAPPTNTPAAASPAEAGTANPEMVTKAEASQAAVAYFNAGVRYGLMARAAMPVTQKDDPEQVLARAQYLLRTLGVGYSEGK